MGLGIPEQIDIGEKARKYKRYLKRSMAKRRRLDWKTQAEEAPNRTYYFHGYSG
jgi:hypothetical protein